MTIARENYITLMTRQQMAIELRFAGELGNELKSQFDKCAQAVEGGATEIEHIIESRRKAMIESFSKYYKITATTFGTLATSQIGKKSFLDDYWRQINKFIAKYTAMKVQKVTNTTKKTISGIVWKGYNAGEINTDIAKKISKVGEIQSRTRARVIARTETHSMALTSTDEAMQATGLMKSKEWLSAMDSRTRRASKSNPFDHAVANGEIVGIDEYFVKTGEPLRYPGDMDMGSAGNIINCRCVVMYHSSRA